MPTIDPPKKIQITVSLSVVEAIVFRRAGYLDYVSLMLDKVTSEKIYGPKAPFNDEAALEIKVPHGRGFEALEALGVPADKVTLIEPFGNKPVL